MKTNKRKREIFGGLPEEKNTGKNVSDSFQSIKMSKRELLEEQSLSSQNLETVQSKTVHVKYR